MLTQIRLHCVHTIFFNLRTKLCITIKSPLFLNKKISSSESRFGFIFWASSSESGLKGGFLENLGRVWKEARKSISGFWRRGAIPSSCMTWFKRNKSLVDRTRINCLNITKVKFALHCIFNLNSRRHETTDFSWLGFLFMFNWESSEFQMHCFQGPQSKH